MHTRVMLQLETEPQGMVEKAGDALVLGTAAHVRAEGDAVAAQGSGGPART